MPRLPLCKFHMLAFPCLASFLSMPLSCFSFYLFLCLSIGLLPFCCIYMHIARMLGARARSPRCEQKGQGCKQEDASPQRAMISRLEGLSPLEWSSLSLTLSLFSKAYIRVPFHVSPFTFPAPCLSHVP